MANSFICWLFWDGGFILRHQPWEKLFCPFESSNVTLMPPRGERASRALIIKTHFIDSLGQIHPDQTAHCCQRASLVSTKLQCGSKTNFQQDSTSDSSTPPDLIILLNYSLLVSRETQFGVRLLTEWQSLSALLLSTSQCHTTPLWSTGLIKNYMKHCFLWRRWFYLVSDTMLVSAPPCRYSMMTHSSSSTRADLNISTTFLCW